MTGATAPSASATEPAGTLAWTRTALEAGGDSSSIRWKPPAATLSV